MTQFDAPPNGVMFASTLHFLQPVTSETELVRALEDVRALSVSGEIGQQLQLRISIDEALIVSIDEPRAGWALWYANDATGTSLFSDNPDAPPASEDDSVILRFDDAWEEMDPQCFITEEQARPAVLEFFRTRTLADAITWIS